MDKKEAYQLLSDKVAELKKWDYPEMLSLLGEPSVESVKGASGAIYQVEYEAIWDTRPEGLLRIFISIDDGSFRYSIVPMVMDFLVDGEGVLVE